jgi:hypothetical protein
MNIQQHNNENNFKLPEELASIGRDNPFSVPKNYFDELPTITSTNILKEKNKQKFFSYLIFRKETIYLFSVCSIIGLVLLVYPKFKNEKNDKNFSEYIIDEKYNTFDEDMLITFLSDNEEKENTTDDALVNYLLNNNTDINLIMEELK